MSEEDEDMLILVRGSERCIAVFTRTSWSEKVEQIREMVGSEREFGVVSRSLMYQASEQKVDKQGRLNLTASLIEFAQLSGEVLIVGYEKKIEIWDPERYREFVESTEVDYLNIARELDI